ncbi:hypothetical protein ACWD1Y_29455 [Streptomyces sp. NPDC002814]
MGQRLTGSGRAASPAQRTGLWQIAGLLPAAGRGPVASTIACDVLLGVLPVVFVVSAAV